MFSPERPEDYSPAPDALNRIDKAWSDESPGFSPDGRDRLAEERTRGERAAVAEIAARLSHRIAHLPETFAHRDALDVIARLLFTLLETDYSLYREGRIAVARRLIDELAQKL